jgi:diacylglycerol kinase family enzyme
VAAGADALGMAGGDGSLAVVAAVAATHGILFACVTAGTRNHFALDVGMDRHDLTGALDAFTGEGPVMVWFLEDYRDDVVLVVRVQHFELSDPAG